MRARFTFRGDSLWWFTELYLHKEQAILTIMRTIVAFDALIDAERPQRVRWVRGDRLLTSVIRELSRTRQRVRIEVPEDRRCVVGPAPRAVQLRATALHAAAIRPRRRTPAPAPPGSVIAFVHRAFSSSGAGTAPWRRVVYRQRASANRVARSCRRAAPGGRRPSPEFSGATMVAGVRGRRHANARAVLA